MTSRLRTCSDDHQPEAESRLKCEAVPVAPGWKLEAKARLARLLLLALLPACVPSPAASVSGTVRLIDSRDAGVRKNNDYYGVIVWLVKANGEALPAQPRTAEMTQHGKRFVPPVLAVPVGSTISFPNVDPIFHNVFSNYAGQVFDVGLYPPGTDQKVRFRRAGIVRVFCNIHPTMSAVIAVLNTPYMAVSDARGAFRIDGVQPGEYRLHVFHERAVEQTLTALEQNFTVADQTVALPPLEISESGYIHMPHKNKYGKSYPKVIVDTPAYPDGHKP